MKTKKQNADFLHIGEKILKWYENNSRELPWRKTKNPYKIWICEIILQQTQVKQGLEHYQNFIKRFPNAESLSRAETDDVLLYWKGLGYYSRALNLHKASRQITDDFRGKFPRKYEDVLKLKGVGKYTAAAICSICFDEKLPAIDGNFYRVLSRIFADDFDISQSSAFQYFSESALKIMPEKQPGNFNQAMMDLGSQICKPKNPDCGNCPINKDCIAFETGTPTRFPVKIKKTKPTDLFLQYYFVICGKKFLVRQRKDDFIWKKLYEFPTEIPEKFRENIIASKTLKHKLTHKNLTIQIDKVEINSSAEFEKFTREHGFSALTFEESHRKSFPKPLENFLKICF
ncbi:MAG: A/G-specific adenine glycosylase [Flavobacteriaceae bacterium]|nr:A/G-specific adenine glycosylase [Flavobacteriaceae bacterium]